MKAYVFPGQGSQFQGMGKGLFDKYPDLVEIADDILGYSISELCLQDPRDELKNTRFTQPAIFVINALSYREKVEQTGTVPNYLAGHSLGEFNALLAAESFDFASGLALVKKRGELMAGACSGAMAAILNADRAAIEEMLQKNNLDKLYIANYNSPSQIVISGASDQIKQAKNLFRKGKMRFYPLPTSGAFHSVFMQDAMQEFRRLIESFEFQKPKIPVIANLSAEPYSDGGQVETLAKQMVSSVRWTETVQYLLACAVQERCEIDIEEVGPGEVLTRLVQAIREQTPAEALSKTAAALTKVPQHSASTDTTPVDAAQSKVRDWNQRFSIGAKFSSELLAGIELETRTEAVVLFGHRAAVYMKDYGGYFDLDEIRPTNA